MSQRALIVAVLLLTSVSAQAPASFRWGGATLTPGGFLDFTSVYRSTNVGSGIGTNFGAIPFANTPQGQLSELRFSAQNSRLSLALDSRPGHFDVAAYVEVDFLGASPGNLNVTSNSDPLRMRLYWVDVRHGSWEILAGQSWSLLTPNRAGLTPRPAGVFFTDDNDTNYQVGLTWARDPQLRLINHLSPRWTLGVSLENPEAYIGSPGVVTLPDPAFAPQFDTGQGSSAPNPFPDIVAKLAYDSRPDGRGFHVELAGLDRTFRDLDPATSRKHTIAGGGLALNGNLALGPRLRLLATSFYSDGGGRYIFGLGPDLVVRPNGGLAAVRAASGMGGFELRPLPAWTFYGYYGAAWFGRNDEMTNTGAVGFGFPGSSSSDNRLLREFTLGGSHTLWSQPGYGAMALMAQYSYLTRTPWSVAPGAPASAHSHMLWLDLRYSLP